MARYWVLGSGNWNDTAHWDTASGGAGGAAVPTTSDDVITDASSDANSYTITINASAICKTLTLGAPAVGNVTVTTDANKTRSLSLSGNMTSAGTPNIGGNSAINRLLLCSGTIGTSRTITNSGIPVWSNIDFKDITMSPAVDLSAQIDIGGGTVLTGCSGITFPAGINLFWYKASGAANNWSTVGNWYLGTGGSGGAGRIPLIQDFAIFDDLSFGAVSMTITQDMPRIPEFTFRGVDGIHPVANIPTLTTNTIASVFGGIALHTATTGMILTASTQTYIFEGRGSYTLTSAGNVWAKQFQLSAPSGVYSLQDAFATTSYFQVLNGTFAQGTSNLTTAALVFTTVSIFTKISGTTTITGPDNVNTTNAFRIQSSGTSVTISGGTIKLIDTSAILKTIAAAGKSLKDLWLSPGSGTGEFNITGSNTFAQLKDDGTEAHSIKFTKSTTQTIADWQVSGSSGQLKTLDTVDGAGTFQLTGPTNGGMRGDYLNIQRSVAAGTNCKWWAGGNSVNNNGAGSGWLFNAPPYVLLEGLRGY
jgi:hypothetical protein